MRSCDPRGVSRPRLLLLIGAGLSMALVASLVLVWGVDARVHDGQVVRNVTLAGSAIGGLGEDIP